MTRLRGHPEPAVHPVLHFPIKIWMPVSTTQSCESVGPILKELFQSLPIIGTLCWYCCNRRPQSILTLSLLELFLNFQLPFYFQESHAGTTFLEIFDESSIDFESSWVGRVCANKSI